MMKVIVLTIAILLSGMILWELDKEVKEVDRVVEELRADLNNRLPNFIEEHVSVGTERISISGRFVDHGEVWITLQADRNGKWTDESVALMTALPHLNITGYDNAFVRRKGNGWVIEVRGDDNLRVYVEGGVVSVESTSDEGGPTPIPVSVI